MQCTIWANQHVCHGHTGQHLQRMVLGHMQLSKQMSALELPTEQHAPLQTWLVAADGSAAAAIKLPI